MFQRCDSCALLRLLFNAVCILNLLPGLLLPGAAAARAATPPTTTALLPRWYDCQTAQSPAAETPARSPVMFIENVGQFADGARFRVWGGDGSIWLAEDGLWMMVMQPITPAAEAEDEVWQIANVRLSFPGANHHPQLEPFKRLDTHVSYFIGNDPDQWRADVPVWGGVRYVDLYPGVDLEATSEGGRWTWRMVCSSTDCASALQHVRLRVEGADRLAVEGSSLQLATAAGEIALPLLRRATADGRPIDLEATPAVRELEVASPFAPPALPGRRGVRAQPLPAIAQSEDPPQDAGL